MKIMIRKKRLGSLSSLLVLSLIQPSANAEENNTSTSNTLTYNAQFSDEDRSAKNVVLKAAYRSHGNFSTISEDVKHVAFKSHISQTFEDYYTAQNRLEENFQDKFDQILDEYEENLKLAANTQQTLQAKENAKAVLAEIKQQHKANQEALKLKFQIS